MNSRIREILEKVRILDEELEQEMVRVRENLRFRFEGRRILFEKEVRELHLGLKTGLAAYILKASALTLLTVPFIYLVTVPLLLLDACITLYQAVCFPAYGITRVRRRDYIVFDRYQLGYLNLVEKLNCTYCAYANGLLAYAREIGARTEQYWCPIKHARKVLASHERYPGFLEFGDAEGYRRQLENLRQELGKEAR